jgi:hypothetical protein
MPVAVSDGMRFVRRLLAFGLLGAGVVYLRGRRRALRTARGADVRFDDNFGTSVPANENLAAIATESGIADVDPEPLSNVAGEGIDLDADVAAHEDIVDLHERLPR